MGGGGALGLYFLPRGVGLWVGVTVEMGNPEMTSGLSDTRCTDRRFLPTKSKVFVALSRLPRAREHMGAAPHRACHRLLYRELLLQPGTLYNKGERGLPGKGGGSSQAQTPASAAQVCLGAPELCFSLLNVCQHHLVHAQSLSHI